MSITASLNGYKSVCRRNIGGVSLVAYAPINSFTPTVEEGKITAIEFDGEGQRFREYQSQLDNAELKISTAEISITHRFNALSSESSIAYNELLEASACGLAALVQMNNGAVALLGWTEEFGARRPLMNIEAEGTSGKTPTDDNYLDVTLKSSQVTAPLYLSEELAADINSLLS